MKRASAAVLLIGSGLLACVDKTDAVETQATTSAIKGDSRVVVLPAAMIDACDQKAPGEACAVTPKQGSPYTGVCTPLPIVEVLACVPPKFCGDGVTDTAAGEECDPGAAGAFTETCNPNCTRSRCGDRYVNRFTEECDPMVIERCNSDCTSAFCGDGKPSPGEDCEPLLYGRDSCNSDCTWSRCGDGKVNPYAGEQCDDGNDDAGDGCLGCQFELCHWCGDGRRFPGEQCEPFLDGREICNYDCTWSRCGDGKVNPDANEQCDDGNDDAGDGCFGCRFEQCQ